jgi:protein-S-isoprenylcysteine O-methyltransferase Ste14
MSRVALAAVSVLTSGAFLILAILGDGGAGPFFSKPPLVALVVVTFALLVASLFTRVSLSSGVREDRSNRWVLTAFGVITVFIAWVPAYTDRNGIGTVDGDVIRWVGVALYAVGGLLRIWPVFVLGNRFSGLVAIQEGHRLVTTGIYSRIRNPSYLGMLINILGWGLAFRSLPGVALAVVTLIPLIARMRAEEALLSETFGQEYDRYRSRTARLIPGVY